MNLPPLKDQKTFTYYPGCSLLSSAREYDVSSRLACRTLGIELKELAGWACCGASAAHSSDELLAISLPARDLMRAGEVGLPMVAACAMCFSRLKISAHELQNADTRKTVGQVVGHEVTVVPPVLHLMEVIDSRLDSIQAKRPLNSLKVACYYGCLLVRPKGKVGVDGPENPQIMDRLMSKIGAEPVDWAFKTECCGAGLPLARPDIVLKLSQRILTRARQAGADCVVVACPECHSNLDVHQNRMLSLDKGYVKMPVLYFTQILGLAQGFSTHELLIGKHLTDAMPMLSNKGLT